MCLLTAVKSYKIIPPIKNWKQKYLANIELFRICGLVILSISNWGFFYMSDIDNIVWFYTSDYSLIFFFV